MYSVVFFLLRDNAILVNGMILPPINSTRLQTRFNNAGLQKYSVFSNDQLSGALNLRFCFNVSLTGDFAWNDLSSFNTALTQMWANVFQGIALV